MENLFYYSRLQLADTPTLVVARRPPQADDEAISSRAPKSHAAALSRPVLLFRMFVFSFFFYKMYVHFCARRLGLSLQCSTCF